MRHGRAMQQGGTMTEWIGLRPPRVLTLVVALALAVCSRGTAQAPGDSARADSVRRAGGSEAPAAPGTPAAPGAPAADRVPPAAGPGSVGTDPTAFPPAVGAADPADTTLTRACQGYPAGSEAPGLLAVIFSSGTSQAERAAAVKAVGGTLAGSSPYGEDYVRLAVGAGPLTAVADRLIRQRPVKEVSPAPCPAAPPTPSPPPADSSR
jgi:hypothetical protein